MFYPLTKYLLNEKVLIYKMPLSLSPARIDVFQRQHPKLAKSEVVDRITAMMLQESTTYKVKDYITQSAQHRKHGTKPVDSECRIRMTEWCYQVVDFCKFRRETVAIGMNFLDRYLASRLGRSALCNRKEYQLAAMTALYLAIKINEQLQVEVSLLADLSHGCFSKIQFVKLERKLLQAIEWRVNGPTCLSILSHLMTLLPPDVHPDVVDSVMDYARFQFELAVAEQSFAFFKSSEVAMAALLNAIDGMNTGLFSTNDRLTFARVVDRFPGIVARRVERIQCKLSLVLSLLLHSEINEIDPRLREEKERTKKITVVKRMAAETPTATTDYHVTACSFPSDSKINSPVSVAVRHPSPNAQNAVSG